MENTDNSMILAKEQFFDLDCYKTQRNNNVLVVGTSGSGKTRSIVTPNILQAVGRYLIVDPKGNLYGQYGEYLKERGYRVRKLNFADPGDLKSCSYNFFHYINGEQDIIKIAHMLVYAGSDTGSIHRIDPFWDASAEILLTALIGYLYSYASRDTMNLQHVLKLLQACEIPEYSDDYKNPLDYMFEEVGKKDPDDFSYRMYQRFRQAAGRTLKGILITLSSKLAIFDTKEIRKLLDRDTVHINEAGERKTAVFVIVSDTDRSMDMIANVFFTQAINELCRIADSKPNHRLPVDVRFILDDFATNVRIGEFPRMIASIRSRGISVMLFIQAEAQLMQAYGEDGRTVIGNCDTYVYLGGNDVDTATSVARRANVPLSHILYMPVGTNWIFRRGQLPVKSENFELEPFLEQRMRGANRNRIPNEYTMIPPEDRNDREL